MIKRQQSNHGDGGLPYDFRGLKAGKSAGHAGVVCLYWGKVHRSGTMINYLILDDDPLVIKIIRHLMRAEEGETLLTAGSRAELQAILARDIPITAALADLNLPDAAHGEAAGDLLQAGVPTLILTSESDDDIRHQWLSKGVVDYINKDGRYWYPYAARMLRRLHFNRNKKILLVEDSVVEMAAMTSVLELNQYSVLQAGSAEQALEWLTTDKDISVMTVDHQLPGMNGLELIQTIRYKYPERPLSIIGVSGVPLKHTQLSLDFIRSGADDFLHKPFNLQEFTYRVNNNAQMIETHLQLKRQTENDFLTGLHNRRYFLTHSQEMIQQNPAENRISMASLDIDHFKKVNDHFGHKAGDIVLRQVAKAMKNQLSPLLLARTGGEEFSVLIPAHSQQEVSALMEGVRQTIEQLTIDVEDGDVLSVTVSIGICTSQRQSTDLNTLLSTADEALYTAKLSGRNQVVSLTV